MSDDEHFHYDEANWDYDDDHFQRAQKAASAVVLISIVIIVGMLMLLSAGFLLWICK